MSRVDVVILTWNDGELVQRAVASVLDSVGVEARVVVIDNGSSPAADLAPDRRLSVLRLERNLGVAVGRSVGVAATTAKLIGFLDSDAELTPTALRDLSRVIEGDPSVGLVSPIFEGQRPEETGGRAPSLATKLLRGFNLRADYGGAAAPRTGTLRDVDFTIGACQLFTREVWTDVRGLDTSYFYGPEDVDFCLRIRGSGRRVVQETSVVCHHPPRRRFRRLFTRRGLRHGWAVVRHLWRHRNYGGFDT